MRLVMETVLEPKFSNLSHGFRPSRGCHTALREIRNWKGTIWFIEGDIKSFFDNIDHHILERLIGKHFKDQRLMNLYWKFVDAGYVEFDKSKIKYVNSEKGVPQGGIISPLLSNLILHELDTYVESIMREHEKKNGKISPYLTNPVYHRLTMRINIQKKKMTTLSGVELYKCKEEFIKNVKSRRRLKSLIPNPKVTKIKYVRYADDWLIGLWGSKKKAIELKELIGNFLKDLKLELALEKTLITNARTDRAKFLGTYIKRLASNRNTQYLVKSPKGPLCTRKSMSSRAPTGNLWMSAPILEIVRKLEDKGILVCKEHRWSPKSISKLTLLTVVDIIRRYNSIMNGIANYYSFADNRRYLRKISWILKESLRKTLSRKLNINKKTFISRFGKDISVRIKGKENSSVIRYVETDFSRRPMLFLGKTNFSDPTQALTYKVSTISSLGMVCSNCGSSSKIEMHHVKHIKTINSKLNTFDKMVAKINRKQVPLCRKCHMEVHKGIYHGKSIKNYNKIWRKRNN